MEYKSPFNHQDIVIDVDQSNISSYFEMNFFPGVQRSVNENNQKISKFEALKKLIFPFKRIIKTKTVVFLAHNGKSADYGPVNDLINDLKSELFNNNLLLLEEIEEIWNKIYKIDTYFFFGRIAVEYLATFFKLNNVSIPLFLKDLGKHNGLYDCYIQNLCVEKFFFSIEPGLENVISDYTRSFPDSSLLISGNEENRKKISFKKFKPEKRDYENWKKMKKKKKKNH